MATYYVDDDGSNTSPYDTWAKAATSIKTVIDLGLTGESNTIYVAYDTVDAGGYVGNYSCTGPSSIATGTLTIISAETSGTTYLKGTGTQFDTAQAGAYRITFSGSVEVHGLLIKSGERIYTSHSSSQSNLYKNCTFQPAHGQTIYADGAGLFGVYEDCTIDCTQDSSGTSNTVVSAINRGSVYIYGGSVINASNRTQQFLQVHADGKAYVDGFDASGLPTGTELIQCNSAYLFQATISNCKLPASTTVFSGLPGTGARRCQLIAVNCGSADDPTGLEAAINTAYTKSSTAVYRDSGASIESTSTSWLVATSTECASVNAGYTPWIYGVTTAGTKTFDIYITNETADLTDAECWIEVEVMGTASSPLYSFSTDRVFAATGTPAAQTDDTTSTWTGVTGTYKQKLSKGSVTVGEAGLYRARVGVAKASVTDLYVDPLVTVT